MLLNLQNIYNTYFQPAYSIDKTRTPATLPEFERIAQKTDNKVTVLGTNITRTNALGVEVFLPVTLWVSESLQITFECCTIRVTGKKTIIRTAVSERKGTVKEQFNVDDYQFTVKGVLIGTERKFPDDQIVILRDIFESTKPVFLKNALAELFLDKTTQIAIESFEIPEVEGKALRHRPFSFVCESDFIDTLKIQ